MSTNSLINLQYSSYWLARF